MNAAASDLSPTRRRWLLAAVMSGLLLAMLDQSIVGTALPTIVQTLGGNDLYVWVATAYLVPATVSLPIYARLSDRHGRRTMLLIGMVAVPARVRTGRHRAEHGAADRLPRAPGPRRGRAGRPLVHPRRRPLRRPPLRRAAGRARGPDGHQLHRRPARGRLPHRPRRLAVGLHGQPPHRRRGARGGRDGPPRLDRPQRAPRHAAGPDRHRAAHRRRRAPARRPQRAPPGADRGRARGDRGLPGGRAPRGRARDPAEAVRRPQGGGDHDRGRDVDVRPVRRRAAAPALLPAGARRRARPTPAC